MIGYNKLCEFEDFADAELAGVIREVCAYKLPHFSPEFPAGAEHRKDWEVAMAVRALARFDALRPDATILGVGAGTEDTIFYLTRLVKQVFATDRYLVPGDWQPLAPPTMLVDPASVAPFRFDPDRLVVQHMDGRWLRYPPDTFDGIFSSGSIEHFGELHDVAYAAYEMGRVLKPGGILALSTEFRLSGPPGGIGWPHRTLVFSRENLLRYIVEASGLEPVDDLSIAVSEATLARPRNPGLVIAEHAVAVEREASKAQRKPEYTLWDFPHLILAQGGYVFGSVHLTLRKTDRYPEPPNEWAKPPASLLSAINESNRKVVTSTAGPVVAAAPSVPVRLSTVPLTGAPAAAGTVETGEPGPAWGSPAWGSPLEEVEALLKGIDAAREEVDERLEEIAGLSGVFERRLQRSGLSAGTAADAQVWGTHQVELDNGISFTAVLEPGATDPVTATLASGNLKHQPPVSLMLDIVRPGDRVLDLGAHVGMFSLTAAATGCSVLAVEASPTNAQVLRSAALRNGFHDLHVVNAVVSDSPGTVQFISDGPWGHIAWEASGATIAVPAVTVDELLAEIGWDSVSFVKLDVEGSEIQALAGMRQLLGRPDAPPVLFESNGHTLAMAGATAQELISAFGDLGYVTYLLDERRLTRIEPDGFQPHTVSECLAAKRRPPGLDGWIVLPSMTLEDLAARIVSESEHPNLHCRAHLARTLASAGDAVLSHPAVVQALEALRTDPEPHVRERAAWSGAVGAARP